MNSDLETAYRSNIERVTKERTYYALACIVLASLLIGAVTEIHGRKDYCRPIKVGGLNG